MARAAEVVRGSAGRSHRGQAAIVALAAFTEAASRPFSGLSLAAAAVPLVALVPAPARGVRLAWLRATRCAGPAAFPVLAATLAVGVIFTVAHLPLYLPGQLYDGLPVWPLRLILLSYSVLLAWIFIGSGQSSLLAGLGHVASNGLTPLTWGIDPGGCGRSGR